MLQTTQGIQDTAEDRALYVALELSKSSWNLAFSDGGTKRPRVVTVAARDWPQFAAAGRREGQTAGRPAGGCAGTELLRSGPGRFLDPPDPGGAGHRQCRGRCGEHRGQSPAPAGEDGPLGRGQASQLVRHYRQERVWSVVRVPGVADEDARQPHRDLEVLKDERRAHRTRIQALLFTHGVDRKVGRKFLDILPTLHQSDGQPLPASLQAGSISGWTWSPTRSGSSRRSARRCWRRLERNRSRRRSCWQSCVASARRAAGYSRWSSLVGASSPTAGRWRPPPG